MSKAIPALDLMFLLTESANNPKHVGALLTFRPPGNAKPGLVRAIVDAYRAAKVRAPFTYVADLSLTGAPRWKTATDLDIHYHVQHIALPEGASREQLLELVADLHEPVLDRNRPGFRAHFIEGLPGGEFAIYLKVHHAIVDGASAMARILASLNEDVTAKRIVPCFGVDLKANRPRVPKGILDRLNSLQLLARKQTAALTDVSIGALKKGLGAIFRGAPGGSLPFTAPHTLMNEPTLTARRFAMLSLPLADMRAAGKACGGTLNDVAATIVAEGIHRYLAQVGSPARLPLVALCPVSLRDADDKEATTKATAMFVPLGAPSASVRERMDQVIAAFGSAKEELRGMSREAAMMYGISAFALGEVADMLPTRSAVTRPLASFVLSNVPGGSAPLYLNGATLTGMFPVSGLMAGVGLNVTLASYAGSMDFGIVANGVAMKRLPDLARHIEDAFAELKSALAPPAPAKKLRRAVGGKATSAAAKSAKRKSKRPA